MQQRHQHRKIPRSKTRICVLTGMPPVSSLWPNRRERVVGLQVLKRSSGPSLEDEKVAARALPLQTWVDMPDQFASLRRRRPSPGTTGYGFESLI